MESEKNMVPEKSHEKVSRDFMNLWFKTLLENDPDKMADLYVYPCSFFPTFDDKQITTREELRAYFERFMSMNPQGETVSKDTGKKYAEGVYSVFVKYDFRKPDGSIVHARNTMILEEEDGTAKAREHHSSETPKPKEH
jgi:hypothetical protein